jgi:osmoprotectant transport system substrate-binding protein
VLPALRQGLVDVVPEYVGTALGTVTGSPAAVGTTQARVELAAALRPDRVTPLLPAAAQNQNGLAVTRTTAERLRLRTTSDLRRDAADLTLAGPTECPRRAYCLQGLERVYGLSFARFVAYDRETQRVTALEEGLVDVAVVFTTDGLLAARDLVLLADDRGLQPAENVVPVVSDRAVDRYGPQVVDTLDAVSAQLDRASLTFLNWRVEVAGGSARSEARGWLLRHGLLPR